MHLRPGRLTGDQDAGARIELEHRPHAVRQVGSAAAAGTHLGDKGFQRSHAAPGPAAPFQRFPSVG